MRPGIRFLLAFLLLFPSFAWTQERGQSVRVTGTIVVRVTTDRAGEVPGRIRIELYRQGILWRETQQGTLGQHSFSGLPEGNYDVVVSLALLETRRRTVYVEGNSVHEVVVRLPVRSTGSKPNWPPAGSRSAVSVRELAVPRKARRQFAKAHRRYRENDLRAAIKHQLRGLEIDPTFAPAHNQLGFFYLRLGRLDKAKESLETALQFDSSLLPAYLNMSTLLAQEGDVERAGEVLSQANQRHPQRGEPYYAVAKIQYDMGNLDQAEQVCREALARDHSLTPEAHLLLVNIYQQRGETDKMSEHLEKYLAEAPEGQFAQQTRTVLKQFRRKRAKNPS